VSIIVAVVAACGSACSWGSRRGCVSSAASKPLLLLLLLPPFRRVAVAWDVWGHGGGRFGGNWIHQTFLWPKRRLQRLLGPFFVFLGAVIIVGGLSPYIDVA